jgi:hypothetical protein
VPAHLDGRIVSAGFASGDRFVIGDWHSTPIGAMNDVMWARASGERVLLAPDTRVAEFVCSVYRFDRVEVVPFAVEGDRRSLTVHAGPVHVDVRTGLTIRLPVVRPRWFTRFVEDPIARVLLDVRTYGVSPTGVREWYRSTAFRLVRSATASIDGCDLGSWGAARPALRVGFGEAPRFASIVELRTSVAGGAADSWNTSPRSRHAG